VDKMDEKNLTLVHEVIDNTLNAELLAEAQSSVSRYKYVGNALLAGYAPLRPYDPVYLYGLTDGMSGVWIVISVTHSFGKDLSYAMRAVLGSNDMLLQIQPEQIVDLDLTTPAKQIPIFHETDTLLTVKPPRSNTYTLQVLNYPSLMGETTYNTDYYNPVKNYIESIDGSAPSIEKFNTSDVATPRLNELRPTIKWIKNTK
jgi:hypothetical protein